MSAPAAMVSRQVERALSELVPIVDRPGSGQWRFKLPDARDEVAWGCVDDGWLRLVAEAEGFSGDEWELLQVNAQLPFVVRIIVDPRTRRPTLCADVNVQDSTAATTRIREAYESLVTVTGLQRPGCASLGEDETGAHGISPKDVDGGPVRQLIEACGWSVSERDGRLVVPIGLGAKLTAAATLRHGAGGRISIDSLLDIDFGDGSETERGAVARFLLAVTGVVRGVRAVARTVSGTTSAGLECGLHGDPSEGEMRSALSALSVAWDRCAREVRALRDPAVADAYLQLSTPRSLALAQ